MQKEIKLSITINWSRCNKYLRPLSRLGRSMLEKELNRELNRDSDYFLDLCDSESL